MSKKYSIIDDKVLRGQDVIATIEGEELDFLEGMAKYRIHAVKAFNAWKESQSTKIVESKEEEMPKVAEKPVKKAEKSILKNKAKGWREVVSEIIGEELPEPDKQTGYHRSKWRDVLMKYRNAICSSKELTPETKQNIMKLFI